MTYVVFALAIALAVVNGANDDAKGVATLAGAGTTRMRTALIWGITMTAVGALLSYTLANKLTALFSKGIVTAAPTAAFAAAVLVGTVAWVAVATIRRLPVSTTHALVGALIGAGILFAPHGVHWNVLLTKVAAPLLISVVAAVAISAALAAIARRARRAPGEPAAAHIASSPRAPVSAGAGAMQAALPALGATPAPAAAPVPAAAQTQRASTAAHWLTSGFTSIARGLNDTPKIAAIASFALLPGLTRGTELGLIAAAMAAGGALAARRVAQRLAYDVVHMRHAEGFAANLTTAVLVGFGAFRGMPMSTTHVSTGSIGGIAGSRLGRLNGKTLTNFAIAWLVTPPFAGIVAAAAYLVLR